MDVVIRADDLGYSEAVNYGIAKSVLNGIVKNVGVMVNMPATEHGLKLLETVDVCYGCHVNICVGKPLTDPQLIPSLVNKDGYFKSSKQYRQASEDFVVLSEVLLEIEAQYHKFTELTGQNPDYFEGHAVSSTNFLSGLKMVADKFDLKYSDVSLNGDPIFINKTKVYISMDSMNPSNYDPFKSLQRMIETKRDDAINMMVLHPGYLDAYILNSSSLTIPRTQEVEMAIDPRTLSYLKEKDVNLLTYRDL